MCLIQTNLAKDGLVHLVPTVYMITDKMNTSLCQLLKYS